jgi:putative hemolysin
MRGEGDFHTLAGFVIDKLRRIPSAGDRFDWEGARFEVVDMDGRRVDKVLVYPPTVHQPEFDLVRPP